MATLVLVEDHQIVRQGLSALLQADPGIEVVADTGDGLEAVRLVADLKPDILIADLSLPGLNGIEVIQQVKQRVPQTQVIVLSMHSDDAYIVETLRSGASAYVLKDAGAEDLLQAVHAVLQGQRYFSASLPLHQIAYFSNTRIGDLRDRYDTLTVREREVLQLVAEGLTSPEIAERLFISPRTVDKHRSNLMIKLGLNNQTALVHYVLQRGLVPLGRRHAS